MTNTTPVKLQHQIAEVERELALRTNVYPGLIAKRKMRRAEADEHMRRMQGVLRTLQWLEGRNIMPGAARPADLISALVHVHKLAQSISERGTPGEIVRVIEDVLQGIDVPALRDLAEALNKTMAQTP